jgi:hypothetical protein
MASRISKIPFNLAGLIGPPVCIFPALSLKSAAIVNSSAGRASSLTFDSSSSTEPPVLRVFSISVLSSGFKVFQSGSFLAGLKEFFPAYLS